VAVNSTKVRRQLPGPSLKCRCYGVVRSKRGLARPIPSPAREAASRARSSPRSTRTKSENKWANARRLKVSASATVAARAAKRRRLIKTAIFNRHSPDESRLRRSVDRVNISSVAARCEVGDVGLLRVAGSKTHNAGVERADRATELAMPEILLGLVVLLLLLWAVVQIVPGAYCQRDAA
jgi:hypothetical protein